MEAGRMQSGFRWAADGVATAPLLDTSMKLRRRKNCGSSATLATPRVVADCRARERGIRCGLRPETQAAARTKPACAFRFTMYASANIVLRIMECCNTMRLRRGGYILIPTFECNAWRNAF